MSSFIDKEKPVIVTGGTGYIASWVVKYLLEDGYSVKTSVRNKNNQEKMAHLEELNKEFPGKLEVFEADLLEEEAFHEPTRGAELVIHTASPFKVQGIRDPQTELVDPALKGTQHVLEAANASGTVKRVVLTSSVVAIYGDATDLEETENNVFTEKQWNTTSSLQHQPYNYSKTVAEKEAWRMQAEQDRWDLLVINPGFVMGPSLTKRADSTSIDMLRQIASGKLKMGVPELNFGVVDVRDVARAHILAGTNKTASDRHILVNTSMSMLEIADEVKKHVDQPKNVPGKFLPKMMLYIFGPFMGFSWRYIRNNVGKPLEFDNTYSKKDLGLTYTDPEKTFSDHIEQMKKDQLL